MGIGRFAFTPLLPLMQAEGRIDLAQGGWLASANYLGYLLGALALAWRGLAPATAARGGLALVALTTLGMGLQPGFGAAWALRFAAGVASAASLVGVSAWALGRLAASGQPAAAGWVFAGVGTGIAGAGLLVWALAAAGAGSTAGWLALGAVAAAVALLAARAMAGGTAAAAARSGPRPWTGEQRRLVLGYGVVGFAYIVPATFLPTAARSLLPPELGFGWVWPVFGAAAAASTLLAARRLGSVAPAHVLAGSQWVMATALGLSAAVPGALTTLAAAVGVGGTFMVATMAAMREAQRHAGAADTRLPAALTAAFGLGQMLGPLAVSAAGAAGASPFDAIRWPCAAGALLLVVLRLAGRRSTAC